MAIPTHHPIPLSLYIHLPWCVRKCPYCDFNSHTLKNNLPETAYIEKLIADLEQDLIHVQQREITSIFFGGGTPSLFSPAALAHLLNEIAKCVNFKKNIEITLEANPGTVEQQRFEGFRAAGINRLSIGLQSLQDEKLKLLGRIHGREEAMNAVTAAKRAGFTNINVDLMYGLPTQTLTESQQDLQDALQFETTHLSWYQLTLEPNTLFYQQQPTLPDDDIIFAIQQAGQHLLAEAGLQQYEVSAYARANFQCQHNINYWQFGDYLGIGAGAHGKISYLADQKILRLHKHKHPQSYLQTTHFIQEQTEIFRDQLAFEFMLNALRLQIPLSWELLQQRTGLTPADLAAQLNQAEHHELINYDDKFLTVTSHGKLFLNDLTAIFLPEKN